MAEAAFAAAGLAAAAYSETAAQPRPRARGDGAARR